MRTWILLALAALLVGTVLWSRRREPAASPVRVAPVPGQDPVPGFAPTPPPAAPPAVRNLRKDPLLDAWYRAVLRKDAPGVLEAQSALLAREEETRRDLEAIAVEDPEPRMRAFSTAVLGRMKRPPGPAFFVARLSDPEPGPRISALVALERLGTAGELPAVEACVAPEEVRQAAVRAAARIRSR